MKFLQLKIGQKFEYQGATYIKSSPLVASHAETGEQRLIPHYAAIVITDTTMPSEHKQITPHLNASQVQIAFDKFYTCVQDSLAMVESECEARTLESIQSRLENARQQFLDKAGL